LQGDADGQTTLIDIEELRMERRPYAFFAIPAAQMIKGARSLLQEKREILHAKAGLFPPQDVFIPE